MFKKLLFCLLLTASAVYAKSTVAFVGDSHIVAEMMTESIKKNSSWIKSSKIFGHNGAQASWWILRGAKSLVDPKKYDLYYISYGTNEMNVGISVSDYLASMKYVTDYVLANTEAKVVLAAPMKLIKRGEPMAVEYFEALKKEYGDNPRVLVTSLLDCTKDIKYGNDLVHPIYEDYRKIGKCVAEQIAPFAVKGTT